MTFMPFTGSKQEGGPMDPSYWLSFSPMAPLFGVKYRYADMFKFDQAFKPNFEFFAPANVTAKPAAKPVKKAKAPAKPKAAAPKAAKPKAKAAAPKTEAPAPVKAEAVEKPKAKVAKPVAPKPVVEAKVAAPKVEEAPAPAPTATDRPATLFDAPPAKVDDLKLIKGVGPKLEGMLNGLGIYTFEQISSFSQAELQWVDDNLTSFKGRAFRDDWIAQSKALLG